MPKKETDNAPNINPKSNSDNTINLDIKHFIILPHQLFDKNYFKNTGIKLKEKKVLIWEHPQYFTKYHYNKKRLLMHRAAMKVYYDEMKKRGVNIEYCEFNKKPSDEYLKQYLMFHPVDKLKLPGNPEYLESPNFLLTLSNFEDFRKKSDKFFFNSFYMWGKEIVGIIPGVKSQDKVNRKRMPKEMSVPKLPSNGGKKEKEYINEAKLYVEKHFPKNYGTCDDFQLPISRNVAKKWLKDFIDHKFKHFGDYEDFINQEEAYLYHSVLSSSINMGLLNPIEIFEEIKKVKNKVSLNNFEGYVRQLFWREYQRYCYMYYPWEGKNYFGHKGKLNKKWYTGDLGVEPVDDAIKMAFKNGYLHHIYRLMVVGNYMNLTGISPKEGFKWFMEFSCDSYEWVMYQNVLDMVFFVSGGATMRKPYASSSNYILKMSDYKKSEWCDIWDKVYHNFMKKHKEKLWKFRYHFPGLKKL
jgi:deoxyribodipyrimidine photolyase-related protein